MSWYRRVRRDDPKKPLYELADLDLRMLGSRDRPTLSAKAAESGTMVFFATWLAKTHVASLPLGAPLVAAGEALSRYMDLTRSAPLKLATATRQQIADALLRFLTLREDAGIAFKPKAHLAAHIIHDLWFFGNPMRTGTWLDEGLNAKLSAVCGAAHAQVWSQRVVATFSSEGGPAARAARQAQAKRPRLN